MKFEIIRSGSKGNATLLFIGNKIFLIDMGICLKTLKTVNFSTSKFFNGFKNVFNALGYRLKVSVFDFKN